ncbi:zinc carboxypeptidase [Bombardia bombarda]|uniref:Zinc carboxypeptidase n=1 Tax=Bombardia bombarda TaxID=252184 RepID=A0AA39T0N4_9PEZI|nr:zinc carboxypeptidase [Bombardia bombarda]
MKLFTAVQILLAPLALGAAVTKVEKKVSYDGYRAFRISTHNDAAAVSKKIAGLDFVPFNLDTKDHMDLAVAPKDVATFEALGLETSILNKDLGADIAEEAKFAPYETTTIGTAAVPAISWFNSYHAYADHQTFLNDLQGAFPANSELISAGTSGGGRPLYGIHIWGSGGKGSKPAVYFHGTVHAREWISTMVVEYLTYQLLTQYSTNTTVKAIVDSYDFYILPIINPDGFVYTQTTNRLWRKNRLTRSGTSCVGTDMNRNWPYNWALTGGASTDPCSETYKGVAAGDTAEIRALVALTTTIRAAQGIKLFIDWHSYGQYILTPFGYSCTARPTNQARQTTLSSGLAARIALSYGTRFTYGPSCSTLYATTGSSPDYMHAVATAEFAWTIELRPSSGTSNGFVLAASSILPAAIEQWQGMLYLLPTM